jgi:hypothetical protein
VSDREIVEEIAAILGCPPEQIGERVRALKDALQANYLALQNYHSECWATCPCIGCEACEPGGAYDQARVTLNQATGEGRDG